MSRVPRVRIAYKQNAFIIMTSAVFWDLSCNEIKKINQAQKALFSFLKKKNMILKATFFNVAYGRCPRDSECPF